MNLEFIVAGVIGTAATVEDLWRRQISNWIPVSALAAGLTCQVWSQGWWGIPLAVAGAVCGFLVFLIFYVLGGMGGGDVKLMAGFGALLGAARLLEAALWTAALGGLLAAGVVAWTTVRSMGRGRRLGEAVREGGSIPYAPAITLGVWLALLPR